MYGLCSIYGILYYVFNIYVLIMLLYALVSWVPSLRGRWSDGIARLVEPVLQPVRRVIPPVAGLDLSFMVVIFLIQWVNQSIVARQMCGVF